MEGKPSFNCASMIEAVRRRLVVSERALRLFRGGCGLLVLLECAERWPVLHAFYSDAGSLPRWAVVPSRDEDPLLWAVCAHVLARFRARAGRILSRKLPRPLTRPGRLRKPSTRSSWQHAAVRRQRMRARARSKLGALRRLSVASRNGSNDRVSPLSQAWSGALQWQQFLVLLEAAFAACLATGRWPRAAAAGSCTGLSSVAQSPLCGTHKPSPANQFPPLPTARTRELPAPAAEAAPRPKRKETRRDANRHGKGRKHVQGRRHSLSDMDETFQRGDIDTREARLERAGCGALHLSITQRHANRHGETHKHVLN